ncbi:MAG TPA: hypothetical protein PLK52_04570, partial [Usitatibacteraceae bacterium]|nr:hypothetical protein [Usitatibacteraceae bacterium]
NLLKGFDIGTGTGTALLGANVGTLAVSSVSINNPGGGGVDLTGAGVPAVNVVLAGLTSGGGAKNVNLVGLGGTVNLGGGTLSGSASHAFDVSGGTAGITYAGTISNTATGARVVSIASKTAGTVALSGAITSGGTNPAGVVLTSNTGATINLTGGVTLSTGTNPAFTATGGGTISVTGAANTLATTTGTAINVANTTIGAAGLTFRSVSAGTGAAGPANAIVLNNTGIAGRLAVTGAGGACTVATPTCTGGEIQRATGDGILLTSTSNPSFSFMNIHNNLGSGIRGTTVNGFLLDNSLVTGNADSAAVDESGIELVNLTGTVAGGANPTRISNSTIRNSFEFELQVTNSSGTLADLEMANNTVSSDGASGSHGNLVNFLGLGTATMKLTLTGGSYTGNAPATATGVQCDHSGTGGTVTCNVSGASFTNNNVAVSVSQANGGNLKFNVANNTATGNRSHGLNLFVAAVGTGTVDGSFLNNTVGTVGVAGSGSSLGFGIRVQNEGTSTASPANVLISGNIVQELASFGGINVNQGIAGQPTSKTTNVTITNNVIREVDNSRAIIVQQNNATNATSAGATCADISGNEMNNVFGNVGDGTKIRLRKLDANGGAFNLRQLSLADLAGANSPPVGVASTTTTLAQLSVGGTPTFAQPPCPQPVP